jgi:hypothetical protein
MGVWTTKGVKLVSLRLLLIRRGGVSAGAVLEEIRISKKLKEPAIEQAASGRPHAENEETD